MLKLIQRSCAILQTVLEHQTPRVRVGAVAARFLPAQPTNTNGIYTSKSPIYKELDHEFETGKKIAMDTLQNLLNVQPNKAHNLIMDHEILRTASSLDMTANFNMCKENGISVETIIEYPQILADIFLPAKLAKLKKLPHDLDTTAPLLQLRPKVLARFVDNELKAGSKSKICELARILETSKRTVCDKLAKKPILRQKSLTVSRIEELATLLKNEFAVTNGQIWNDLYSLLYNPDNIREKLMKPLNEDIGPVKTWMIRSPAATVDKYIKRRLETKEILAGKSRTEFLAELLKCDEATINHILEKRPDLKTKNLKLIQAIKDSLESKGFTTQHIIRSPKILSHSLATAEERLKFLDLKNIKINNLSVLAKSRNQFNEYVEKQIRNKINKWAKKKKNYTKFIKTS